MLAQLCAACESAHATEVEVVCPIDPPDLAERHAQEIRRLDHELTRTRAELEVVRAELAVRTRERDSWESSCATLRAEKLRACGAGAEP